MNIIRPATITDSVITSDNVEETASAAYNSGTTYALGNKVSVAISAGLLTIYQSLQDTNLNHTPSTSPTWWLDIGDVYQTYSGAVTYALYERVQDNTNHLIYESLLAGNVGNALTDIAKWIQVGATNRWKMFDTITNSQTIRPDTISVNLLSTQRIDSIALLGVDAASVTITMTDSIAGVVYNQTVNMVSDSGIGDWWSYFYEPIVRKHDILKLDMPAYASVTVGVLIDNTGFDAACGTCVIGLQKYMGGTMYGASVGIQDYSTKTRNVWGDYTVVERAFNKRARFDLHVDNTFIDEMQSLLTDYRTVPIVYVGSDLYASTWVFGFYKTFDVVISYFSTSKCSIEIEGLT